MKNEEVYPKFKWVTVKKILHKQKVMLHEELKQARLSQGISLRELEKLSGVGFSHTRKIEAGADASTSTINKICQALGVTLTITKVQISPSPRH